VKSKKAAKEETAKEETEVEVELKKETCEKK
jgi:hypothetical protein